MIFIEITDEPIATSRPFSDKTTGETKPGRSRQNAYIHQGDRYPLKTMIAVPDAGPYRPGNYLIGGALFSSGTAKTQSGGDYAVLKFNDKAMTLTPVAEALKAFAGKAA